MPEPKFIPLKVGVRGVHLPHYRLRPHVLTVAAMTDDNRKRMLNGVGAVLAIAMFALAYVRGDLMVAISAVAVLAVLGVLSWVG